MSNQDSYDSGPEDILSDPADMQLSSVDLISRGNGSKKKKGGSGSCSSANENTGRWTAEEHRLFLQGLEQHGKGWKKIASLIKTRTVVQIRTHAQKYFQKLAKARQNGEEGDVTMEGRGDFAPVATEPNSSTAHQVSKRRRQSIGKKRKAIHSVVVSAQRQGNKICKEEGLSEPPLPAIAPTLAHFLLPEPKRDNGGEPPLPLSGPALEDSIFRFLSVAPPDDFTDPPMSEIAKQAGASTISLPTDIVVPASHSGEESPTGVSEISLFPAWTNVKESPAWYTKGADVEALLDVAEGLDWYLDSGEAAPASAAVAKIKQKDMVEPVPPLAAIDKKLGESSASLPRIDSSMVPQMSETGGPSESSNDLRSAADIGDDHLKVFDSEHDLANEFVSSMLEDRGDL